MTARKKPAGTPGSKVKTSKVEATGGGKIINIVVERTTVENHG